MFDKDLLITSGRPDSPLNMVENQKDSLSSLAEGISQVRVSKLRAKTLEDDLLVLTLRVGWKSLKDAQKIEQAVAEAEVPIMRWHTQQEFSPDTTFDQWIEAVKTEFGAGRMSLAEFISQKVGPNEPISDFLRRMTRLGDATDLSRRDQMSVIKKLLASSNNLITDQVLVSKEVTKDLLETVAELEALGCGRKQPAPQNRVLPKGTQKSKVQKPRLCLICEAPDHGTYYCPKKNLVNKVADKVGKKSINALTDEDMNDILNKDTFVYVAGVKFSVLLDTGATDNYMSKGACQRLNLTPKPTRSPIIRYAVDDRKITLNEYSLFKKECII